MIKELQRKFVLISLGAVALVLLLIIGSINIASYSNIVKEADYILEVIARGGGAFPKSADNAVTGEIEANPETQYEHRFFTVTFLSDSDIVLNLDQIAAVDAEMAIRYAYDVRNRGHKKGFKSYYRYLKTETATAAGVKEMYVFLDCNRELLTFYYFLFAGLLISVSGLILVAVLLTLFSKYAVRPIAESYERQKRFITDASHELKTPLTIISANTDVLEIEQGSNEWTESIKKQINRLRDFTDKLVLLAKTDEGGAQLNKTELSLTEAVREAVESFRVAAETQGKTLVCDIEDGINYYGDAGMLKTLIDALIDNAVKYSNAGGTIHAGLRGGGSHCVFTVYNTADEIDVNKLDKLFERFYRLDESRNSETGGHGIGMSAAKAIVTAHGGKISADSDGKSMTLTVIL